MAKVVKESQDYTLQAAPSLEEPNVMCYQLVNRVFDVVEVETQLLPQAYQYLEELQAAVDAARDIEKDLAVDNTPVLQFPH